MSLIAATPFSALLALFFAVPLVVMISVYGSEGVSALLHHRWRSKRP